MSELYTLPDGWEWKNLEYVCGKDSSNISLKTIENDNGIYPIYGAKGLIKTISSYRREESYISIIKDGAGVGRVMICQEKSSIIGTMQYLIPKNNVSLKFLFYFLSTIDFNKYINGATIPHIYYKDYKNNPFPLPPIEEQKRIVDKLDILFAKIDKAIALHQKNIDEANVFMVSVLNDIFVELEEKYEKIPLFDVADVNRGKSKHRPRNDKKLFGGNYPFIQTGDVRNANKYINTFNETYSEFGLSQSKLWKKGTICMTIAANIGDVAILNIDSCFPDSVVGIYSENNSNDYLYYFLLTLKQQLESQATTTAQMNINLKVLQTIGVPLPPVKNQQKVVSYLDEISQKVEKIKQIQKEKMQSLKELKVSILDQAFRGEL
ncbi:restriction endonuclease subunit S [Aliarcobacter cryaerophilus]|uniref:restriction endonuclease subunit S n=1 Tax=Aliarcobacter TaxID=2321111 RepID=UPI002B253AAE|nr:restriction endonuclease subunit S [Aliarcobacter butzleri]